MASKLRVGLLGTGFIQESYHVPALRQIADAEIVAVFGRTEANASDFARRWGIPKWYHGEAGLEAICKDPAVDLIDVGLPNSMHLGAVTLAAENHKAIICEKPLGRGAEEAKRMLDAAERYGVVHCYAENDVFIPRVAYAKKLISEGSIGKVTAVRAREAHSGPHRSWFKEKEAAGGGVLLDMGCHCIELARHLIGKRPKEVCAWLGTFAHKIDVEDNAVVLVRYESGELGQSESSWSAKGGLDVRFEIFGTEGSIFIDLTRETGMRVFAPSSGVSVVEKADATSGWLFPSLREHETYGFLDEMKHFVDCAISGRAPIETFADGYIVNSLVDCAYDSAATRKWSAYPFSLTEGKKGKFPGGL